jgi:hypothetical protein
MKKLMIAALIGLSALPTAAQAAPSGSTICLVAFPGAGGWLVYLKVFCK